MIPNHRKYPLNEAWLHKTIASVFDFDAFNSASSSYLKPASPLLIPADDAVARELLNTTIEDKYRITYNATKALEILNQYCINVGGTWYTKNGPSQEWLALYPDHAPYTDALPDVLGVNVPLGPWKILDISGWTDVNAIDVIICDAVTNTLGIKLETNFSDYSTYLAKMDAMDFDLVHYCMELSSGNMYQRYSQIFTGPVGAGSHYGDYRNPQLDTLICSLETVPASSQAQHNIANQIQEIIGSNLPVIPVAGHPNWYIYNEKYWIGWPNQDNPLLPAGPYGTSMYDANLHAILLGLRSRTPDLNGDGVVDILDITLAAAAFGAVRGDERWNPIADINADNTVDIIDIAILAKAFGTTI
jgi:ABC-type oligopeptide transport system substrate-binding subunit